MTHGEDELLTVPEAGALVSVIEANSGEIEFVSCPPEILVRLDEDRSAEFDGFEGVIVWEDDG